MTSIPDDLVGAFQIEGEPVRGRIVRLGTAVDEILRAHTYPDPVANLLGEACALAAAVGSNLKFDGRLIVQAQGSGPVRYVVADYDTERGISHWTKNYRTSIESSDPEALTRTYEYYDPIHTLPEAGQAWWAEHGQLDESALKAAEVAEASRRMAALQAH